MKLDLKKHFFKGSPSDAVDLCAAAFIFVSFLVLVIVTFNVGLYADDYWNLFEAKKHDTLSYFANHMTTINSRYTYAIVNRLLFFLCFDPNDMFGWTFIRTARISILCIHCIGVWFLYKSLVHLKVPKVPLLLLLPFVALPSYAHQALFWIGAAFAHPLGFALFSIAGYALLTKRYATFSIATFFSLGASEFVLMPSIAVVSLHLFFEFRNNKTTGLLNKKHAAHAAVVLIPFIAWAAIVILTPALSARVDKVLGHAKLMEHPVRWLTSFFRFYLTGLMPEAFLRDYGYIVLTLVAAMIVLIRDTRKKVVASVLAAFYPLSLLPLSAVGYGFKSLRHLRLYYLPGIFFYVAVFSIAAFVIDRLIGAKITFHKTAVVLCVAAAVSGATAFSVMRLHDRAKDGEQAYGCIRATLEAMKTKADGRTPSSADVCGLPPLIYDFSLFRGHYAGPYAAGLAFGTEAPIPFTSNEECRDKRGIPLEDRRCPFDARYRMDFP